MICLARRYQLKLCGMFVTAVILAVSMPAAASNYVGRPLVEFKATAEAPLVMPTAVTVSVNGHVFVVDGVNDRVVHFSNQGDVIGEIRSIGSEKLSAPMSAKIDEQGRLWIADTGNRRVVIRQSDGGLGPIIKPGGQKEPPWDPVEVAPLPDGRTCWVVDNDNHRIARLSATGAEPLWIGTWGESLGQFEFPFLATTNRQSDLFVVDVINGRIQVFNESAQPVMSIGSYGITPGRLYRPKGVAIDGQGHLWVSDSVLGTVQVFTTRGRFLDVLKDDLGQILQFDTPIGLTFDKQDRLYVVEANQGRVLQVEIIRPTRAGTVLPQPTHRVGGDESRACTVCHLEWMSAFQAGDSSAMIDRPPSPPEEPYASKSNVCLSCHDGSVMDSRRHVWLEHGHQTGVKPPEYMAIPNILPLVNGQLACRTCHSAHNNASGQVTEANIATAVFLRMPNQSGQMCMACHKDKTGGPAMGTHPVGGMPWAIPQQLVQAGAKPGPNPREITCQVCHTAHGTSQEHLLVMTTQSSQLCLTCHAQLRPGMWRPHTEREHPQNPPLSSDVQRQAIQDMGTRTGTAETLICLSCHKLHHGLAGTYLLADTLHDSRLCVRCHPDRGHIMDSPHDLRITAPDERNRLGQDLDTSGPCGACHSFHRFARLPNPQPFDPTGMCVTCHAAGECAQKNTGQPFSHPMQIPQERLAQSDSLKLFQAPGETIANRLACLTCHDPHEVQSPHFLIETGDELCANCHTTEVAHLAGKHDFSARTDIRNARDRTGRDTGKCGFCHAVHDAAGPKMWIAMKDRPLNADELCLRCHNIKGLTDQTPPELRHPSGAMTTGHVHASAGVWPLFKADGTSDPNGSIACGTCHDLHADSNQSPALLRAQANAQSSAWCSQCHVDTQTIATTAHAEDILSEHLAYIGLGSRTSFCGPCHDVHARTDSAGPGTWAAPLGDDSVPMDMRYCLGCHGAQGAAIRIRVTMHPTVPMLNESGTQAENFLPLVDEAGQLGAQGRITCQTCHVPHGRKSSRGLHVADTGQMGKDERRDLKAMLRPYVTPNLCSGCHGFDGLRYFLYYHYPEKRKTELNTGANDRDLSPSKRPPLEQPLSPASVVKRTAVR